MKFNICSPTVKKVNKIVTGQSVEGARRKQKQRSVLEARTPVISNTSTFLQTHRRIR